MKQFINQFRSLNKEKKNTSKEAAAKQVEARERDLRSDRIEGAMIFWIANRGERKRVHKVPPLSHLQGGEKGGGEAHHRQ
jgi:hypothetical protein